MRRRSDGGEAQGPERMVLHAVPWLRSSSSFLRFRAVHTLVVRQA
jgi:hypothetical protein